MDGRTAHQEFYAELRAAFLAAGPPTYTRLVVIMRRFQEQDPHRIALGTSALQAMMRQGGKRLPRWAVLSSVIEALRTAAQETGLDPDTVGTIQHWHNRLQETAKNAWGGASEQEANSKTRSGLPRPPR